MDAVLRLLSVSLLASASCVRAWNTYVVPHVDGADDTLALASALASGNYSLNSTILFKKGVKYNILTPITFPKFTNVEVAIEGNLTYPESKSAIQGMSSLFDLQCAYRADKWLPSHRWRVWIQRLLVLLFRRNERNSAGYNGPEVGLGGWAWATGDIPCRTPRFGRAGCAVV